MTNAQALLVATARAGIAALKVAAKRGPLLERQQASRNALECAAAVWANVAGGPSTEHPTLVNLAVDTFNAHGHRVRVDLSLVATRLPDRPDDA